MVETCLDSRILGLLAFFFLCVCKACVSSFLSKAFLPLPTRLKRFTFGKFSPRPLLLHPNDCKVAGGLFAGHIPGFGSIFSCPGLYRRVCKCIINVIHINK